MRSHVRRSARVAGLAAVVLLLGALGPAARAEDVTEVEAEGVAAVIGDDLAHARDRALDDARRRAVEQVAGAQVSAQTITRDFQLVEDRILSRASGFVKTYRILSEGREEGVVRVRIMASVDRGAVAGDLAQLFAEKPRVIVLVAEQNAGARELSYWWGAGGAVVDMGLLEASLVEAWRPRGFKFVDAALLAGKLKASGALKNPALSDADAIALSRDADADVAIVGKVLVTDAGPVMDGVKMRSFQAVGTLRALDVDTGQVLAAVDQAAVGAHVDANAGGRAAIKALGKKLSEELERRILERWTAEAAGATELELTLTGAVGGGTAAAVERALQTEVRGVESLQRRRKSRATVSYTVRFKGTSDALARALEARTWDGFTAEVASMTRGQITLELSR